MEKNKMITARDVDFAKWYTDIVKNAHLATYSNVKGCVIIEPNGYAIWENIQKVLDQKFKDLGHSNVYMPLFIPESLLNKEKDHVKGFAPEVAWVTHGGENQLEERMCVRPTSETLFCDYYKDCVKSYRDLPKLYNQWCNVVRWEKETRPFLRTREFLWQEGHTLHETKEEAEHETYQMLEVYRDFYENYLAIPTIIGKKTEKEKFAGAEYTLTIEAMMYNGVCLQGGTSHFFGQQFTKPFDIKYATRDNTLDYPYQTSWGVSTRMIGGLIMVHSDDNGLVLPPRIAPKQIVIIPITDSMLVAKEASDLYDKLKTNFRVFIDNSDKSPGYKYAEHEMNGIPLRIEIGPKDLEKEQIVLARRDTGLKISVKTTEDINKVVEDLLTDIHNNMYNTAKNRNESKTYACKTYDEVKDIIDKGPALIKAMWCGSLECELKMKEIKGLKSRCIPFIEEKIADTCICCGKKAKHMVYFGNQY